jgi:hypothetical protein
MTSSLKGFTRPLLSSKDLRTDELMFYQLLAIRELSETIGLKRGVQYACDSVADIVPNIVAVDPAVYRAVYVWSRISKWKFR